MTFDSSARTPTESIANDVATARRMARCWCRAEDADDIAQEAAIRLVLADVRPTDVAAWLWVVTRRLAARKRRREAARAAAETTFAAERPAKSGGDFDLWLDVDGVLSRLSARDRRLLTDIFEGAQSREVAAVMGCAVRDVGQMVARARRKARRLMGSS